MAELIEFKNGVTGQQGVMSDVTPRHTVLQAYAEYTKGDMDTVDLEGAYGSLVERADDKSAKLGDWVATVVNV